MRVKIIVPTPWVKSPYDKVSVSMKYMGEVEHKVFTMEAWKVQGFIELQEAIGAICKDIRPGE